MTENTPASVIGVDFVPHDYRGRGGNTSSHTIGECADCPEGSAQGSPA